MRYLSRRKYALPIWRRELAESLAPPVHLPHPFSLAPPTPTLYPTSTSPIPTSSSLTPPSSLMKVEINTTIQMTIPPSVVL